MIAIQNNTNSDIDKNLLTMLTRLNSLCDKKYTEYVNRLDKIKRYNEEQKSKGKPSYDISSDNPVLHKPVKIKSIDVFDKTSQDIPEAQERISMINKNMDKVGFKFPDYRDTQHHITDICNVYRQTQTCELQIYDDVARNQKPYDIAFYHAGKTHSYKTPTPGIKFIEDGYLVIINFDTYQTLTDEPRKGRKIRRSIKKIKKQLHKSHTRNRNRNRNRRL